mmetsp:Transcript_5356/g.9843  ORF Transcript_5356/g.9843 Transcript_5356/m.9843 type:complete len:224 (-) Transcript_5356:6168-6839(-)
MARETAEELFRLLDAEDCGILYLDDLKSLKAKLEPSLTATVERVLHNHIFSNRSFLMTKQEFVQAYAELNQPPRVHLSLKELIVGDLSASRIESVTEEADSELGETLKVLQELEVNVDLQRARRSKQSSTVYQQHRQGRPVVDLKMLNYHASNYEQEELKRLFMKRKPTLQQVRSPPPKKPVRCRSNVPAERLAKLRNSEPQPLSKLLEVRRAHLRLSQGLCI